MAIPDDIRRMLVERCRARGTRDSTFTPAEPCEWNPRTIKDPRTGPEGAYFTEDSAWEFVAETFKGSVEIEVVPLDKPPGKKGYVAIVDGLAGIRIYIKLQLKAAKVHGRSFHVSKPPSDPSC